MADYRKPSYSAALNMAKLVYFLAREGRSMTLEEITETLSVSERTARRYLKSLNECPGFVEAEPLIVVTRKGGIERWALNDRETVTATHYQLVSLFMASVLMTFLEGTVARDGLLDIIATLQRSLPRSHKKLLHNHVKKLYYTAFGAKRYDNFDEQIDVLFRGVLLQRRVAMSYVSQRGENRYSIHPYTLLIHRDALYLIGYSESHQETRTFAVDKIADARLLEDSFDYPEDYSPDDFLKGSFGIFTRAEQERIDVEIEFDEELYDYVANRNWIPGQKTTRVKNGKFRMRATVTDLFEIGHWVLGMGSAAVVLKPEELREMIVSEVGKIATRYDQ